MTMTHLIRSVLTEQLPMKELAKALEASGPVNYRDTEWSCSTGLNGQWEVVAKASHDPNVPDADDVQTY